MAAKKARKATKAVKRNASSRASSHQEVRTKELVAKGGRVYKFYFASQGISSLSLSSYATRAEALKAGRAALKAWKPNGKKRNSKTIIKAKRVTILNLKKNPAFEILKEATPATKGSQTGWKLGKSFYAKGRGQAKLPGGALLDLGSGFVYRRVANPKRNPSAVELEKAGRVTAEVAYKHDPNGSPQAFLSVAKNTRKALFPDLTLAEKVAFERAFKARLAQLKAIRLNPVKKRNIAGFMADGVFHPIRSGVEQRTTKSGVRRVKSKKAYKPSKVGEKRTYSAKKAAKRGVQSKRMTAATKQRKATTTRLASRLLDRSGPKKTRRNPGVAEKLQEWRGYPKDRDDKLRFPDGTPSGLYKLGALKKIVTTHNTINFASNQAWLCADTKGKLYVGGIAKSAAKGRMTNVPAGSLGKVTRVEYLEKKPHLKDYDKTLYFHKMGEEDGNKPTLYSDGDGNLLFRGGNYQVTYRGIVN